MSDLYLDHVLIGVRDLDAANLTFGEKLGFKVTPEGRHPGRGTHNRLVVFGPEYLELISIADPSEGLFRPNLAPFLDAREGLFIFAMGTDDIDAAVATLRANGGVTKDPEFGERRGGDGGPGYSWRQSEIRANVTPGSQTFFIQHNHTVEERYTEPPAPTAHPNGVIGISRLALAVRDAESAASEWQRLFGLQRLSSEALPDEGVRRVNLDLSSCSLDFVSPLSDGPLASFIDQYGEWPYVLGMRVADLDATLADLSRRGVPASVTRRRAVVGPEHAQGVRIEFVEA